MSSQPLVPDGTMPGAPAAGDPTMNVTLPPEAWRSEAFAEDLSDEAAAAPNADKHRVTLLVVLLGALPVALAAAGAVAAVWSGA